MQELVVRVELVVFFLYSFDAVEDFEKGFVELLCVSVGNVSLRRGLTTRLNLDPSIVGD